MDRLRIGILGAAKIAPRALIKPAHEVSDVEIAAVAASVLRGEPSLTPAEGAVVTMGLIDQIYTAAGLPQRGIG